MESLKEWREPAAWLTIGALALTMLLGVIELVVVAASLQPTLALGIGAKIGNPTIFVMLAGSWPTACWWSRPRGPGRSPCWRC